MTFEPLHYLLQFKAFKVLKLIFAVFLSYAGVELLSVSLQGFNAECVNGRISHIWLFCDIFAYSGQKLVAMAKTKLCTDMLHTTEVMANFVIFGLFWQKFGYRGNVP